MLSGGGQADSNESSPFLRSNYRFYGTTYALSSTSPPRPRENQPTNCLRWNENSLPYMWRGRDSNPGPSDQQPCTLTTTPRPAAGQARVHVATRVARSYSQITENSLPYVTRPRLEPMNLRVSSLTCSAVRHADHYATARRRNGNDISPFDCNSYKTAFSELIYN